jgi:5'-deoxynucleotidase
MVRKYFSLLINTATVTRYSGSRLMRDESVMEHIGSVAALALFIGLDCKRIGTPINMELLLTRALVHDLEESVIGDISNPTKYHSKQITDGLNALAKDSMTDLMTNIGHNNLIEIWETQKDESLEGRILKLCDVLSVVMKLYEEVVIYSNRSLINHAFNTDKYFQMRKENETDPVLKRLIEEAISVNQQILSYGE